MSADNGIYIGQFNDGFRVIHAQAIENLEYYPPESFERQNEIRNYFCESPVFKTKDKAFEYAQSLYDSIMKSDMPIVEYGICWLGHLGEYPKDIQITQEQIYHLFSQLTEKERKEIILYLENH